MRETWILDPVPIPSRLVAMNASAQSSMMIRTTFSMTFNDIGFSVSCDNERMRIRRPMKIVCCCWRRVGRKMLFSSWWNFPPLATAKLLIFMIRWHLARKLRVSGEPFGDLETSLLYLNRRIREKVFHHQWWFISVTHSHARKENARVLESASVPRERKVKTRTIVFALSVISQHFPKEPFAVWVPARERTDTNHRHQLKMIFPFVLGFDVKKVETRALSEHSKVFWRRRESCARISAKKGDFKVKSCAVNSGRKWRSKVAISRESQNFPLERRDGAENLLFSSRQVTSKLDFSLYRRKVQLKGKQSLTEPWKKGQQWKMKKRQCEK